MRRDSQGEIRGLRCSGHAAFDIEGGVDIVCAGVSALTGALALGLSEVVGKSAQVLLKTAVLALRELEKNYQGFVAVKMV